MMELEGASDRSFGWTFSCVFALVALLPLVDHEPPRWWAIGIAVLIGAVAALRPSLLAIPNRWWTRLGLLLGRLTSPIAIGVLFYAVIVPFALGMRIVGRDALRLKRDAGARSYWIERDPPGPPADSMPRQF